MAKLLFGFFLSLLFLISSSFVYAGAIDNIVDEIANSEDIKNALWSISVKDTLTGKAVYEKNSKSNVIPASILKILVTSSALDYFGPEHRFSTKLYYSGKIKNGILSGNILIRGGGDPSLGSEYLKNASPLNSVFSEWLSAIKKLGINEIDGAVIADESMFNSQQPGAWSWEDIGNYYAAQPSALTILDNFYRIYFSAGKKIGDEALLLRVSPDLPEMIFENKVTTAEKGTGDNVFIYSFPGIEKAIAKGTLPLDSDNFAVKGALPDPALFTAKQFTKYLLENGIEVAAAPLKGNIDKRSHLIAESKGVRLSDIIYVTNKKSFNLYAELLLRHLASAHRIKNASGNDGIKYILDFLKKNKINTSELKLTDASGLSRRNLVNSETMTDVLCVVSRKKYFKVFYDSLVFPNDSEAFGQTKRFGKNYFNENNLRVKSGSINGVRAYTGYLTTKSGKLLAFTFILNNYTGSPAKLSFYHESILKTLYEDISIDSPLN